MQAEQTKQVWAQCSDVEIVHSKSSQATVGRAESQQAAEQPPVCIRESLGLDVDECRAWIELYDALNGPAWVGRQGGQPSLEARRNPCGISGWWDKTVVCNAERDYKHITCVYVAGLSCCQVMVSPNSSTSCVCLSHLGRST